MYGSTARLGGRAIHPVMVVFPIALFTVTVAMLLAYIGTTETGYYQAAMVACLAGVVMAPLAFLPGTIAVLPLKKGSRARAIGMRHSAYALLTTGIFTACAAVLWRNWFGRVMVEDRWLLDATVPLAIAVVGMVTLVIVGTLGWTLVHVHQVGTAPANSDADRPSHFGPLGDLGRTTCARSTMQHGTNT